MPSSRLIFVYLLLPSGVWKQIKLQVILTRYVPKNRTIVHIQHIQKRFIHVLCVVLESYVLPTVDRGLT